MKIRLSFLALVSAATAFPSLQRRGEPLLPYLVHDLPGLDKILPDDVPLMYSGQVELYAENKTHYYFWKHLDKHKVDRNHNRTTFWLNGGPGCSSMDGALMESGPFRINDNLHVTYNQGSWHRLSDMVYVDQPGGTGFSYTDNIDHDLDQVSLDFMRFLQKYFEIFPQDRANDIYLAGESYAGQYIPYIAEAILRHNQEDLVVYNLKGLLIGNGWISPNEQSALYVPFSVKAGLLSATNPHMSAILKEQERCQEIVSKIDAATGADTVPQLHDFETDTTTCEGILTLIINATLDPTASKSQQCINVYDYTLRDETPACGMMWPPDVSALALFLREDEVMDNLNLKQKNRWTECDARVGRTLKARNSIPSIRLFPRLLEQIPIMLFNGEHDIICNTMGVDSMVLKLKWGGQTGFSENLPPVEWIHANKSAGIIKSERNLTVITVYNASHMVPFDKPDVSRALLDLMTGDYDAISGMSPIAATHALDMREEKPSDDPVDSSTTSRITRIIQFAVLLILFWGLYGLYSSYRSRPSSIIKTSSAQNSAGSTGSRKKNVQWAEQLRRFQSEEQLIHTNTSFLSKAINKIKGENRGNYTPPRSFSPENARPSLELQDLPRASTDHYLIDDEFIIASDDESDHETTPNAGPSLSPADPLVSGNHKET